MSSKTWFWEFRAWLEMVDFTFEKGIYKSNASIERAEVNARILGAFVWTGIKSLIAIIVAFVYLTLSEEYIRKNFSWFEPLSADDKKFHIEQIRLYAQLLTAIFSIYFATIGIILSAGYTRLRRDIIQMLTNEQIGSVYSRFLVFSAMFCLAGSALPLVGFDPGILVNAVGILLTILSAFALFPLGQRLFNFFDLNQLVRSEILPNMIRHINRAASSQNSNSLANHHSKEARNSLEQLYYIDDRVKKDNEGLRDNLPALSNDYTVLLIHYLQTKHTIDQESYWFPRQKKHKQWFFAGDATTTKALQTSSQQLLIEEKINHEWFENEVVKRLSDHVNFAFKVGDFELASILISSFSNRISAYVQQFQFHIGTEELKRFKEAIESVFSSQDAMASGTAQKIMIEIAETWAVLGSNLCIETLHRMMTFEKELKQFFDNDEWTENSLRVLPSFLQVELAFIVDRIEFEQKAEGRRLSKPKYVQQLAIQKLLMKYSKVLPEIRDFYKNLLPSFVNSLSKFKMSEAATQVTLTSLHSHWRLSYLFDEFSPLLLQYYEYEHYKEENYKLPEIDITGIFQELSCARDDAIVMFGSGGFVDHIFELKQNDELPDHFGQIYFELAEACINALEHNNKENFNKVFPMFFSLTLVAAEFKFLDPSLDVNNEYRLHLISTVINDLASVIGFAILYGAYFDNETISESAITKFDSWIRELPNEQEYLERMLRLSNPNSFSMSASPRGLIRINWKMSFESLVRRDGFSSRIDMYEGGKHPNRIVQEFLRSGSDASHLFFAKQVLPRLESTDLDVNYRIRAIAQRLNEESEEVENEGS
ncbi:hypothetical protein EOL70_00065 [Leucothrix sargassi]|nr:hypothetical protein EOL70_00065 [Leucothrix sargassi]